MGGFPIGRVAGIDILVHWSWVLIFGLLTWSLAEGLFLHDYPNWTRAEAWFAGAVTSLVLFASILLHELSHSLVARRQGMSVRSITLFIFGGVSAIGEEPRQPGQEFSMAAVGPLTSFALAGLFGLASLVLRGGVGTAAGYLAFINVLLGAFNLLPGFPLDGGRVLRSIAWARTGSMMRATRIASFSGEAVAFLLMAGGAVAFFLGDLIPGVWFFVIGWFLLSQARASYRQLAARHALSGFNVGSALSRNFDPVRPEISLASFLSDHVLVSHRQSYPVLSDGRLLGVISLPDLKRFPRDEWHERMVSEAMTPQERLVAALPSDDLMGAAERMAEEDLEQLPVVEDGRFIGFVTRSEIVQLIRLGDDLGGSPIQRRGAQAEKVGPRA
jgi:Zn-dependent protease